jgi:hypothetical protein
VTDVSKNLTNAVIFGAGLAIGLALGNAALAWSRRTLTT